MDAVGATAYRRRSTLRRRAPRLPVLLARSAGTSQFTLSTYQQYSSYPSAPPQGSNDLWLSSRPSPHATISAAPLHVRLHRRAFPAADAVADDRRPLGVAAQAAQAGIFHGHGRRRLAREDAAAGRGRRGAHLAASPQLVSCTPSRPFTTTYICWPCSALKLLGKRKKYNRW